MFLFVLLQTGFSFFPTLCVFPGKVQAAGAVLHLVVPARGFLLSYRVLKMPVVPCYPGYVRARTGDGTHFKMALPVLCPLLPSHC